MANTFIYWSTHSMKFTFLISPFWQTKSKHCFGQIYFNTHTNRMFPKIIQYIIITFPKIGLICYRVFPKIAINKVQTNKMQVIGRFRGLVWHGTMVTLVCTLFLLCKKIKKLSKNVLICKLWISLWSPPLCTLQITHICKQLGLSVSYFVADWFFSF